MRKKFIKEPIFETYLWYVCDCELEELRDWVLKKFKYEIETRSCWNGGKLIIVENEIEGTLNWIIWSNNPISLAHELIHFVSDIFRFYNMTLCKDNEELFCRLHTYYYMECLKVSDIKEK